MGGLYFVFVFFIRNRLNRRSKVLKNKKKELAPIISNFLFHNESATVTEQKDYVELKIKIREELKNPAFRAILSEILTELQKDVSGDTKKRLNQLYCELELHLDAYEKLKSTRWQLVSKGILELTQMQVYDAYPFIIRFLNHKRSVIRKQAEIATVSLRSEGISHFLDTTAFAISEWQQLKIMEVLRAKERFAPPSFKAWLIATNRDVVLFALRLIKHYNQNDAVTSIIELLKHKDDNIKIEAIYCIKEFCVISALPILKAVYHKTSQGVKLEILDAIATLGSERDLPFLEKMRKRKKASFTIKNKIAMAINDIVPDSVLPTKDIIPENKLDFQPEDTSIPDSTELEETSHKILQDTDVTEDLSNADEEIGEIEVFELDEDTITLSHQKETNTKEISDKLDAENDAKPYEIGELSEEMNQSVNDEIGLVPHTAVTETDADQRNGEGGHIEMSAEEKELYISTLEDVFCEDDIPLLEEIMENEADSELRFRIFKILKSNPTRKEKQEQPEVSEEATGKLASDDDMSIRATIFYDLFAYASDVDSKCIIINQMVEVGDQKELPFLKTLTQHNDKNIKTTAQKALDTLLAKFGTVPFEESISGDIKIDDVLLDNDGIVSEKIDGTTEKRLPMELCFLYDEFGIVPPKEEDTLAINFDLAEEFYTEQYNREF